MLLMLGDAEGRESDKARCVATTSGHDREETGIITIQLVAHLATRDFQDLLGVMLNDKVEERGTHLGSPLETE